MNLQPTLKNDLIILRPLSEDDFEATVRGLRKKGKLKNPIYKIKHFILTSYRVVLICKECRHKYTKLYIF